MTITRRHLRPEDLAGAFFASARARVIARAAGARPLFTDDLFSVSAAYYEVCGRHVEAASRLRPEF
jgi:hypothetical protein